MMDDRDGWQVSQRNLCYQYDLIIYIYTRNVKALKLSKSVSEDMNMKRSDLIFSPYDKKPTKSGGIVRYCWGILVYLPGFFGSKM